MVGLDVGQDSDCGDAAPRKVGVGSRYSLEQLSDRVCLVAAGQPSVELGVETSGAVVRQRVKQGCGIGGGQVPGGPRSVTFARQDVPDAVSAQRRQPTMPEDRTRSCSWRASACWSPPPTKPWPVSSRPPPRRRMPIANRVTPPRPFTAAARSLEAGHAACSAAHDLGLGLGEVVPACFGRSACSADGVRDCPRDPPSGCQRPRTYGGQRWRGECHSAAFAQVSGYVEVQAGAVCKTVGSAYVGSNPTPATYKPRSKPVTQACVTGLWRERERLRRPSAAFCGLCAAVAGFGRYRFRCHLSCGNVSDGLYLGAWCESAGTGDRGLCAGPGTGSRTDSGQRRGQEERCAKPLLLTDSERSTACSGHAPVKPTA